VKPQQLKKLERELAEFIDKLTADLGRPERREALRLYMTGLLLDGERKSIQPLAARLVDSDAEIEAMRQRLQQAVVVADWDDGVVRSRLAKLIDKEMPALEVIIRRHRISQERQQICRGSAAVFGDARSYRQLPSRHECSPGR
jgi:SRSO17 transposase